MNAYATIILATLLVSFALELIGNVLNLRALRQELPDELRDLHDPEAYRLSQQYTRDRTRLGLVRSVFDLSVVLAFWFSGGFNLLDQYLRGLALAPIWTGLLYVGVLAGARMVLAIPFGVYSTFCIEARYGFNRTTPSTFILDTIKMLFLAVIIGGPLLALLFYVFEFLGLTAWLWGWGIAAAFTVGMQIVFPTWIMPLFNKFTPLGDGELKDAILSYAKSVQFPIENVFVIDGSRRSNKTNAFFTGFGKHKKLALFDTLMESHSIEELVAIFAHEVGHSKRRHIVQGTVISLLHTGLVFFLLSIFLHDGGLFRAFFMESTSIYAGFVFFGMLYVPIELVLSVFLQMLSRRNEYQADNYAATTVPSAENMVDALKKLSKDNLTNLTPHPFLVFMSYSPPPIVDRIRAIRAAG